MTEFHCKRCGNCCRWKGCVKLSDAEVDAIAAYLGMPVETFLEQSVRLMPDRTGLSLNETPSGSCIFLEDGSPPSCRIEPVKPHQCRDFPLRWNFPGWEKECGGTKIG